jgi:hypothetical protein
VESGTGGLLLILLPPMLVLIKTAIINKLPGALYLSISTPTIQDGPISLQPAVKSNKPYALVGKRPFREDLSSRQLGG